MSQCDDIDRISIHHDTKALNLTTKHGKCSKILNTLLSIFLTKLMAIRAGINKMLVRMANWDD